MRVGNYCVNGVGEFSFPLARQAIVINLVPLACRDLLRRWWCDMHYVRVLLWLMVDTVFSSVRTMMTLLSM